MVAAWAAGRLDREVADVRPHDRLWWRRLHLKIRAVEDERVRAYAAAAHRQHLAGVVAGEAEFAKREWRKAAAALDDLHAGLFPWVQTAEAPTADALTAEWERWFGRRGDPAVEDAIARTAAGLAADRAGG